ncbi:hypothetical protein GKZ89_16590 [Bacillus mangrovi]|uniref:Mor transcription activator domain-containing protein n=1 Tax=Metabacillus mangrovi TaxID=1491830 RepID=A0A7X2S7F4_9BACI|nr:hypothetical protein [Metabacillus mangrovi]
MKRVKAADVLPENLLQEIQKYVQGETLYIPKQREAYAKWGTRSGGRKAVDQRNAAIRLEFKQGISISTIAETRHLSEDTVKKIVYSRQGTD